MSKKASNQQTTPTGNIYSFKIVLIGSSGVGKTSMVQRLIDQQFTSESQSTVGVEFKIHEILYGDDTIKLNIWDTAGQEKFRSVAKSYFRNSLGCLLTYSIIDKQSFSNLDGWINDFHSLCIPNASVLVVGNKNDLAEEREVSEEELSAYAKRYDIEYIETSAKNGNNIDEAFLRLAKNIMDKVKRGLVEDGYQAQQIAELDNDEGDTGEAKKCC